MRLSGVAMAIVLGIAPAAMAEDTIKIGTVTPNTGGMAQSGNDLARSYELAADRINAEGGVLGKKLVIIRGAASTANEGISAVEQLVGREKVDLLIGTIVTAIANSASDSALNYGKLYWETSSLSNDLTDRGLPNFARTGPSGGRFREALGAGRDRPRREETRQAAEGFEGLDRERGLGLRHDDRQRTGASCSRQPASKSSMARIAPGRST